MVVLLLVTPASAVIIHGDPWTNLNDWTTNTISNYRIDNGKLIGTATGMTWDDTENI